MAAPSPKPNLRKPQIKFSIYWMYVLIILFLAGMYFMNDQTVTESMD